MTEQEWWEEDAERINAMAKLAKDKAVEVVAGKPPTLNPDGSLKKQPLVKVMKCILSLKGSSSSGNFAHAGRPGKRGGSAPGGGLHNSVEAVIPEIKSAQHKVHDELSDKDIDDLYESSRSMINAMGEMTPGTGNYERYYPVYSALADYKGEGYKSINKALRSDGAVKPAMQKKIDKIEEFMDGSKTKDPDSISMGGKSDYAGLGTETAWNSKTRKYDSKEIAHSRAPKDMVVYRAIGAGKNANELQFKSGDVYQDKGFVSTSVKKTGADTITDVKTMMRINVPKGTKGFYMDALTKTNDEYEYLLPKGSKFKVQNVTKGADGIQYVDMELLNDN